MDGARAIFFEHFEMQRGAVSLMTIKAVQGIFFVVTEHKPISCDFGNNRSCHAGKYCGICFYDCLLRSRNINRGHTINNHKIWVQSPFLEFTIELKKGFAHRKPRCLEDIYLVDEFF